VGLCEFEGSGWMDVGGWDRIGSGFVDEGFDGMQDARRAPPTVRLETLALGNH
jgi:hypothetical protein